MKKKIVSLVLFLSLIISLAACSKEGAEKEYNVSDYRTTMQYYDDFKVLQLTDLHLGIETDLAKQLEVVKNTIEGEKPDLVILTGDNFMFSTKSIVRNLMKTLNEACASVTASRNGRLTKFAVTYGNHDNQGDYPIYFINEVVSQYTAPDGEEIAMGKYAAFRDFSDDDLTGLTNFYIDIVDDRMKSPETVDVKYRLHIIDSNAYHFVSPGYGYDVIHEDQLNHAVKVFESATKDRDYIGMAFFHIPLFEYEEMRTLYNNAADKSALGQGEFREGIHAPFENNGSFDKLYSANIVSYFCGHDHINYGDFLYTGTDGEKAVLSFGVKSTNQLYHEKDMIGYKTVMLRDITKSEFLSIKNLNENFKNVTGGNSNYEN